MRRPNATPNHGNESLVGPSSDSASETIARIPAPARVLIVSGNRAERNGLAQRLADASLECIRAASAHEARLALNGAVAGHESNGFDLVLIQWTLPDASGLDLVRELRDRQPGASMIMLAADPKLDDAINAMRSGAVDLVSGDAADEEFLSRVRAAVARARHAQAQAKRIERLKRVCRRLNTARQQVTEKVGSLCNDLVDAYQELADQMDHVSTASEFSSLVRQELEIEELLRTALEFILAKVGPTNAAVFLPATSNDFSLGAYINYSCPRDSADMLLDHLAAVLAPRFEDESGIAVFDTTAELSEVLHDDLDWMGDSSIVVFNCEHEGECLAVVALFRDRASPFPESMLHLCKTIRDIFAAQLARVIRIHHRHLPKDQWDPFGEPDDGFGDIDMAA